VRSTLSVAFIVAIASVQLVAEMPRQSSGAVPAPQVTSPEILHATIDPLLRDSAQIFSGIVLKVEHRNSDSSSALATTSIHLRVDQAIRNVRHGQIVEVKEWGGLWQSGERYHPGERVLLFLYPLSKLGLTSPVGHRSGSLPINSDGNVLVRTGVSGSSQPIAMRRVVAAIRQAEKE
jgi:hypothetical protein